LLASHSIVGKNLVSRSSFARKQTPTTIAVKKLRNMFHVAEITPLIDLKTISSSKTFFAGNTSETSKVIGFSSRFLGACGKWLVAGSATSLGGPVSNVFVILFAKVLQRISSLNRPETEKEVFSFDVSELSEGSSAIVHGPGSGCSQQSQNSAE
jgi:hypothetical protein